MSNQWARLLARHTSRLMVAAAVLAAIVGCGTDPNDRTEGGAATGAASGAAVGIIGGPIGVLGGAIIGGGAGALTGAVTSPSQMDLGAPPWSDK
jgi:hypothetical protein